MTDSISPSFLTAVTQKTVYRLQDTSPYIRGMAIALVAIAILSAVGIVLLNHFQVLHLFSAKVELYILGADVALASILICGSLIYLRTQKYNRNKNKDLGEELQFLTERPKAYISHGEARSSEKLREETPYHDWYKPEATNGNEQPVYRFTDTIKCRWNGSSQEVYQMKEGEKFSMYSAKAGPKQFFLNVCIPFFKDNKIFLESQSEIISIDVTNLQRNIICTIKFGEKVTHIRYSEGILILGYESGLVQLIKGDEVVASYKAEGEVLDCWIVKDKKQLVTYSGNTSGSRKREVWQF